MEARALTSTRARLAYSGGHLCAALLAAALCACSGEPRDVTTVELWAMGREGEVVEQLLPDFERHHPGVRVRVQQIPWSAAHEKLLTAYVGGTMPDVFQAGNTWLPELAALGAIEPLDARLAGSKAVTMGDYFPGILATNVIDGSTYGLPWYVDTRLLFYRADLLAAAGFPAAPRTWDAWVEVMHRIRQQSGGRNYAILLPFDEWQTPVILALQLGADLLRDGDRYGHFRSREFRQAFAFYLGLFERDLAPHAAAAQVANLYQEFANGYFCFFISGPWNIGELRRRTPESIQWSTAPLPSPDGRYPGASTAGGASLVLFRGSPHKALAWQLVEYLSDPARQLEFYRLTGDLPARRSAWVAGELATRAPTRAFWEQLQFLRSTPKIPEWEQIADRIGQYTETAIRGALPIDDALAALDEDVDRLLEKRRWLLRTHADQPPNR